MREDANLSTVQVFLTLTLDSAYRGGMIQTAEQYQFLHHTLALYASQLPPEPNP